MKNNIEKFSFQLYRIKFKFLESFKKMKFVPQIRAFQWQIPREVYANTEKFKILGDSSKGK